jgi:hypothetical protein
LIDGLSSKGLTMQILRIAPFLILTAAWNPGALVAQVAYPEALRGLVPKTLDPSFAVDSKAKDDGLANYRDCVAALMAAGFPKEGKPDLAAARQLFDKARAALREDPRAHFALAIVQLQAAQAKDALRTLKESRNLGGCYPPAFELRTLHLLYQNNYGEAAAEIQAFAKALSSPTLPESERERWAVWLGNLLGFYESSGESDKRTTVLREARDTVRARLPAAQQGAFDKGLTEAGKRYVKFGEEVAAAGNKADDAAAKELEPLLEKIFSAKDAAKLKAEGLKKTQEQMEEWYGQQMDVLRKVMALLLIQDQALRVEYQNWSGTPAQTVSGANRIEQIMFGLGLKIAECEAQRQQVVEAVQRLNLAYAQATGKIASGNEELKAWTAKLDDVRKRQEKNVPAAGKEKKKILDKRMRDVKTYFRADLKQYAAQLLKSFDAKE